MSLWSRIANVFRGERVNREIDEELEAHVAEAMADGRDPAEARRALGSALRHRQESRDARLLTWLENLTQDIRYALRTLRKSTGFAAVAILTLALGIGASTAIFSVIENVLLAPFPYKDAGRLVYLTIHDTQSNEPEGRAGYSSSEYLDYAEQNHVFDRVIAAAEEQVLYKQGEGTERLYGAHVTPGTFEFLGMPALYGRVAEPADYEPGAPPVFVMRYKTWMNQFNGDLGVLNKTFVLNGMPRTLIGIMPPRFGWYEADVMFPDKPVRGARSVGPGFAVGYWFLLGHLAPGVTQQQAEADLAVVAGRLAKEYPKDYPAHFSVQVASLLDEVTGKFRSTLLTVMAAVALLLLIGCGNVANLMLARATGRDKEFAVRAVLGAGRLRLVRQLLVESLILAMAGAALGILLAWGGLKSIVAAMPGDTIPTEAVIELNGTVLVFTLCVAVLTALIFGLVPALQVGRRDLNLSLRDSGKGLSGGTKHSRLRDAVVVLEVALSLTLLVGAGLLMRSFVALREEHLGFRPDHVLFTRMPLPQDRYKTSEQLAGFFRPLLGRLKALPGVVDVAEAFTAPPNDGMDTEIEVRGNIHEDKTTALFQLCSEGYFPVLRFEFKSGRVFSEAEVNSARKVAVVNQAFVRKYFANENPIGQRVRVAELESFPAPVKDPWFEIVGVVADVKNRGLQQPIEPEVWVPYTVTTSAGSGILVRTAQEPLSMMNVVRQEIWATDPGVALSHSGSMEGMMSQYIYAGPRFGFLLMAIFGSIGLILVTIGVYSVLAYTTARRTHEIGIRMALGAKGGDVLGLVIKTGLRLVLAGVAVGLMASLALSRVIETQLWGVSAYDPVTLGGAVLLLLATGVLACWIPARRASRVEPLVALRYE
jgi:putative ABC transport system permease protein